MVNNTKRKHPDIEAKATSLEKKIQEGKKEEYELYEA